MAKIDTSRIAGYADMSLEDKLKALEAFEYNDNASELEKQKAAVSKANSEAAEWKRKHNAAAMQKELNELRRDKTVSQYTAKFIAQGYDEKLAADTAKAMADGNTDKVFANQQVFLETYAKQVKASAMQGTPKPASGSGSNGADFSKKAADAQSTGNFAEAAYYTRLMNQDNNTQ